MTILVARPLVLRNSSWKSCYDVCLLDLYEVSRLPAPWVLCPKYCVWCSGTAAYPYWPSVEYGLLQCWHWVRWNQSSGVHDLLSIYLYWMWVRLGHMIEVILFANHKANGAVTNIGLSS
jgi:hypothetical protein